MNPIPPFVANKIDDSHCVPAVYRMLYKHFLNKDFTWEQIDEIAKAIPGKGIWNVPLDLAIAKEGIQVRNIELTDYQKLYDQGIEYLKKEFGGKNANYYTQHSNVREIIPDIPEFLKKIPHESRKASIDEIIDFLKEGKLIAAEVNSGALGGSSFMLHFVLIYGFDGKNFYLHDPGLPPKPERKVSRNEFIQCFVYEGSGQGIDVFWKD